MRTLPQLVVTLGWCVRFIGVLLGLIVIIGGALTPIVPVEIAVPTSEAQEAITRPPNSLFLFGVFLIPFWMLRPGWLFWPAAVALTISSVLLVLASIAIFRFHLAHVQTWAPSHLEEIAFSGLVSGLQPVAVLMARRLGCVISDADADTRQ